MQSPRLAFFISLVSILGVLSGGCSKERNDEELLKEALTDMEQHIENGDLGKFMDFFSDDYLDSRSNRKQDVRNLARLQILRNRNRHLFQQVTQIHVNEGRSAEAVIIVAMTGQSIDSATLLRNMRAELMKFKVEFVFDDRWRVISAEWARAEIGDFL